jgi:hypothetical protein
MILADKTSQSLKILGFELLAIDKYIYFNSKTQLLVITYINDFLIFGSNIKAIDKLKINLHANFYIKNIGPVIFFLGVYITRNRKAKTIILCQDIYIRKILAKFRIKNCYLILTLIEIGTRDFIF